MPHLFALAGLLIFSVLGLGSATRPDVAPPPPEAAAPAAEQVDVTIIDRTVPEVSPIEPRRVAPVENIGDGARVSQAHWSAHTIIPSKNFTVVGSVVVRNTTSVTVLADLMERAIAMGGHDIKNVIITHTITDNGARISSAIAVVIRYTNETLTVREEGFPGVPPTHVIMERYLQAPRDVGTR